MTNAMETLYMKWAEKNVEDSIQYERILEKYGKDFHEYLEITMAVSEEQRRAFTAGFQTAVQLLMGGASE